MKILPRPTQEPEKALFHSHDCMGYLRFIYSATDWLVYLSILGNHDERDFCLEIMIRISS